MLKPTLTVFTPTYNRAYTLHLCYESLVRQSCKDFIWLIIDDGSSDNTRELVESWKAEGLVPIYYHYQENQGMHGAHNTAYELIDTELNVCIDSDDYMADDAVKNIVDFWKKYGNGNFAGIVALDATPSGEVIGTKLPDIRSSQVTQLYTKHKVRGDKKLIYRSELTRKTPPYPIFPGEKYCPLSYKYMLIDQQFPLLIMNEIVCHVEYRPDGSSMNMIKQYRRNPRSFSFFRKEAMKYAPTLGEKFRESVHYVSSSLMIKNYKFVSESPYKWITLLSAPVGGLLYCYIHCTNKKTVVK